MDTEPTNRRLRVALFVALCLTAFSGTALGQASGYFRPGDCITFQRDSTTTGYFLAFRINTDTLCVRKNMMQRLLDSLRVTLLAEIPKTFVSSTDPDVTIDSTSPGLYLISVSATGSGTVFVASTDPEVTIDSSTPGLYILSVAVDTTLNNHPRIKALEDGMAGMRDTSRTWRTYVSTADPEIAIDSSTAGRYIISITPASTGRTYVTNQDGSMLIDSTTAGLYILRTFPQQDLQAHGWMNKTFSATEDSAIFNFDFGTGIPMIPLPYNMYLDRFVLHFKYATTVVKARGPTSFDNPPIISSDSTLYVKIRKTNTPSGIYYVSVFKVARADGWGATLTSGNIVDMVAVDTFTGTGAGVYFPNSTTGTQVYITINLSRARPY